MTKCLTLPFILRVNLQVKTKSIILLGHRLLPILLSIGLAWGQTLHFNNNNETNKIETGEIFYETYGVLEQSLLCDDGEIDLGWGDCNDIEGNTTTPNGCMPSGCFSVEETNELSFSYINLGEFPSNIGELTNLQHIHISDCGIHGLLPTSIENLTNLVSIQVYDNDHDLPDSLGLDSQLSGSIPSEIANLDSLRYIRFDNNNLTGDIPSEIGELENLIYLILSGNQLMGDIPSSIMSSSTLVSLALNDNQFSGHIPIEIVDLVNLQTVNLSHNLLTGTIPSGISGISPLYYLDLSHNQLMGNIDEQFCEIYFVDFSDNSFCAPYPICLSEEELGSQDTTGCSSVSSLIDNRWTDTPNQFKLNQNYPNPFNPSTFLSYYLPQDGFVNITVYDIIGRRVKIVVNYSQSSGYKLVEWNGTNNEGQSVAAGVYLYSIEAGKFRQSKKMILLK